MKNTNKAIIVIVIFFVLIYVVYASTAKNWQLSLYGDGTTLMRLDYKSKEACLSAGSTYYGDGKTQYQRFDCGYKCSYSGDKNDLNNSPICSTICDSNGCK